MIRTLTLFSLTAILLSVLYVPFMALQPGAFILGGHYNVGPGETLPNDISIYFAQVTVAQGATVEGRVFLYSSTLDLSGVVSEDIRAFESDLTLRSTARVQGEIYESDFIHWTLLLPKALQLP